MSTALYRSAVTVPLHVLDTVTGLINKAKATTSITPASTLASDMLPLSFQVKMVCDLAHKSVARTTFTEPAPVDETLATWDDCLARVAEARKILEAADEETINQGAAKEVTIGMGPGNSAKLASADFIHGYVTPNLYFHTMVLYSVLRKEGVEVGKRDFLTPLLMPYATMVAQ